MAKRTAYPIFKGFKSDGTLASGYKLYTYEAGTSTPLTTYSDNGVTPHTNPIILDSLGEAEIWITESAKFTLTDADDNVVTGWPVDNIDPTTVTASEVSVTPPGDYTSTDVQSLFGELSTAISGIDAEVSWTVISSNTTAENNKAYLVDTSGGAITLTAPASPGEGDKFYWCDISGSFALNNLTIDRNSSKIMALEEDMTVGVDYMSGGCVYSNSTYGWVIIT